MIKLSELHEGQTYRGPQPGVSATVLKVADQIKVMMRCRIYAIGNSWTAGSVTIHNFEAQFSVVDFLVWANPMTELCDAG